MVGHALRSWCRSAVERLRSLPGHGGRRVAAYTGVVVGVAAIALALVGGLPAVVTDAVKRPFCPVLDCGDERHPVQHDPLPSLPGDGDASSGATVDAGGQDDDHAGDDDGAHDAGPTDAGRSDTASDDNKTAGHDATGGTSGGRTGTTSGGTSPTQDPGTPTGDPGGSAGTGGGKNSGGATNGGHNGGQNGTGGSGNGNNGGSAGGRTEEDAGGDL